MRDETETAASADDRLLSLLVLTFFVDTPATAAQSARRGVTRGRTAEDGTDREWSVWDEGRANIHLYQHGAASGRGLCGKGKTLLKCIAQAGEKAEEIVRVSNALRVLKAKSQVTHRVAIAMVDAAARDGAYRYPQITSWSGSVM